MTKTCFGILRNIPKLSPDLFSEIFLEDIEAFHGTKLSCKDCLWLVQWWQEVCYILFCLITPINIGQISKPGTVSESACPEDSETVTGR